MAHKSSAQNLCIFEHDEGFVVVDFSAMRCWFVDDSDEELEDNDIIELELRRIDLGKWMWRVFGSEQSFDKEHDATLSAKYDKHYEKYLSSIIAGSHNGKREDKANAFRSNRLRELVR